MTAQLRRDANLLSGADREAAIDDLAVLIAKQSFYLGEQPPQEVADVLAGNPALAARVAKLNRSTPAARH